MASIRVDELVLPITEMYLVPGGLEMVVEVRGPHPESYGNIRVFNDAGEAVTDMVTGQTSNIWIPKIQECDTLKVTYKLDFGNITPGNQTYIIDPECLEEYDDG